MKSTKRILTAGLVVGIGLTAQLIWAQPQAFPPSKELYNNAANPPAQIDFTLGAAGGQFGDQVFLDVGLEVPPDAVPGSFFVADLDSLFVEYWADVATQATVRLYSNDGTIELGGETSTAPSTMLFESTAGLAASVAGTSAFSLLDAPLVPLDMTWTIEFDTPLAGLRVTEMPTVGNGTKDIWVNQGSGWELAAIPGVDDSSFTAVISGTPVLVPEPSTIALVGFGILMLGGNLVRRFKK